LSDKTIVVVGNGGSALEYKAGKFIDSCDDVVRFNNYKTDGFEEYVGYKTTIWVFNSNPDAIEHRDHTLFKRVIVNTSEDNFLISSDWANKIKDLYPNLEIINNYIVDRFREKIGCSEEEKFSSGLSAICSLLPDYESIYIHGFDFFGEKYKDRRQSLHYFDNSSIPTDHHVPDKEMKMVDFFINIQKVKNIPHENQI